MKPMSTRAYAAHRRALRLPGNTLRAVQEAVTAQRIPARPDGTIDAPEADAAWEKNTDASRRPHTSRRDRSAPSTLPEAKRREAVERTRKLRLENEKAEGRLVLAADAERMYSGMVIEARNALRGIPSRAKLRIPHLTAADLAILAALIDECLESLADRGGKGGDH